MIDSDGSSKGVKLFELLTSVLFNIFSIDLFVEGGILLVFLSFFNEGFLSIDFVYLFRFEIISLFKL